MVPFLLSFLALQLFYTLSCSKVVNVPQYAVNSLNDKLIDYSEFLTPELFDENDDHLIITDEDKTELKFLQPLESVNIDYDRNAITAKLYKNEAKVLGKHGDRNDKRKQNSLQDNFIRFGKRSYEEFPLINSLDENFLDKNLRLRLERSQQTARDARGDNFMRFGRSVNTKNDFMRFGRAAAVDNFMRFGRTPNQDFMRFGRTPNQDFMRFGRTPSQDFMRFGRTPSQDFMRFGRTPSQDFMRFGRTPSQDFMRFGRANQDGFMRFGRNSPKVPVNTNFMRYSRPDNFMRFGRAPPQPTDNFMRFGKSFENTNDQIASQPIMGRNELKQAVKLIHEADENADSENPVDKAIKVLFDKQQQIETDKSHREEPANAEVSNGVNETINLL